MKKCGFIIRVSTDRQAQNKEGSLKNQLQRLRAHIEYKNTVCEGEEWVESEKYILKAVSGKDSFRSREFALLFEDIRAGKINTIICTALDRVCRSVKDFLSFFEILHQYDVEFVCLKQNYDTTSPQGKLFITIMMALAEFEREQTSERNKEATMARAERGLWNGGQLIGFDLDPEKKGYINPNEKEKIIVNFAFDKYLQCGSILSTASAMNDNGFRTKEYTSRRDEFHPADTFSYSSVQHLLTNHAYIGKKEINKKKKAKDQGKLPENERYRIVDAVWESIIDEEKFYKVQDLLKKNCVSKHNQAKTIRHNYILNSGLLCCDKCGTEMEGRSGTAAKGVRYYYYICKDKDCRFKVPADEIERIVLNRIKELSEKEDIMSNIINSTNEKLQQELPKLKERRILLQNELAETNNFAEGIMGKWASLAGDDGGVFFKEKLDKLGKRRKEIENGIQSLVDMIEEIEKDAVNQEMVMLALNKFSETFDNLQPHLQKDLLRLVLHKVLLAEDKIKIALYGHPSATGLLQICEPGKNSQMPIWLPGPDSNQRQGG